MALKQIHLFFDGENAADADKNNRWCGFEIFAKNIDFLSQKLYTMIHSTFLRTKEKQQFPLLLSSSKPRVYHAV
ncbi:MAG: hypothetical protein SOY73_07845 [Blautia sp.]|nr:hypothetical protein [Blautia sp.]